VLIADYHAGLVDYDGHTQSFQSFSTDTYEQLARLGIQLELAMALTDTHFIMGLHKLYWDRDIYSRAGVQGLHEVYQWYEIHAGFHHRFFKTERGYGWAQLTAFNTSSAKMEIRLPNETPKFNLGEKPGVKFSLGWQQSLDQYWNWGVSAFAEYREFGKSPSVFVNDFYGTSDYYLEPRSESKLSGVNLHFTYSY
jgi:hypothetical protein